MEKYTKEQLEWAFKEFQKEYVKEWRKAVAEFLLENDEPKKIELLTVTGFRAIATALMEGKTLLINKSTWEGYVLDEYGLVDTIGEQCSYMDFNHKYYVFKDKEQWEQWNVKK